METLTELIERYPKLAGCQKEIEKSAEVLIRAFEGGKRLYLCGNGGSAADADHIVGELMKGFLKKRPLPAARLVAFGGGRRAYRRAACRGAARDFAALAIRSVDGVYE